MNGGDVYFQNLCNKLRATPAQIMEFLDNPYWLDGVNSEETYYRTHDDNDGEIGYGLSVAFSRDGDAWVNVTTARRGESCRFRTGIGGGKSLRVRAALMILALAIDMDNKDAPLRDGGSEEANP